MTNKKETGPGGLAPFRVLDGAPASAYHRRRPFLQGVLFFFSCSVLLLLFLLSTTEAFAGSPLSGLNPADLAKTPDGIFLDGRGFTADNARMPVKGLIENDWSSARSPEGANRALAYWEANVGAAICGWRLALFHRGDFLVEANRDTVDFIRMVSLKEQLPTGRVFDLSLSADGFSAKGVEVSKGISLYGGLSAGITARYLSGGIIQNGTVSGIATASSPSTYDFNFLIDYGYDNNLIYPRDATPGSGNGYSFDAGLRYSAGMVFSAGVLFRDILGRIYWTDVPYTTATATSTVPSLDSSGYQQYRPTIQGFEGYRDFTQKLPLKVDIDITGSLGPVTLSPTVNIIDGRPFYWVFLDYKATQNTSFNAGYNTNFRTYSLGAAYKKSRLNVYSSHIDPSVSASLGVNLSLWYEW